MKLLKLALKSAWNRKISLSLAIFSIAISIMLLLGVDTIRKQTKNNFINTITGTDLVVGARSGSINLLLYSIFRIGNATNNVSYKTYQDIAGLKQVKWAVPISLGDSHRGFRVMGTSRDYFEHYRYANKKSLTFLTGTEFDKVYETVLGHDVAKKFNYKTGQKIILSHGIVSTKHGEHDDKPFTVVGILDKTGTPVDRTVHVSLQGIEAIHIDWQSGTRSPLRISAEQAEKMGLEPKSITAFMLGLNKRIETFRLQRKINEYKEEPLLAIIPGTTLAQLWRTIGQFETVLIAISSLVLLAGLIGLLTTLLTTLNERRREMAVLRAVGAHAYHVILLFILESLLVVIAGCLLGLALLYGLQLLLKPVIAAQYGIHLSIGTPDMQQWTIMLIAIALGGLLSLLPGLIAYRRSLQDGLTVKL